MKIKRPSLKGMKNTKYLGHFAQDKYMKKGHNLSGSFPMFREPSQLEMMGPANPFDVSAELKRRQAQVDAEAAAVRAQTPDNTGEVASLRQQLSMLEPYKDKPWGYRGMPSALRDLPAKGALRNVLWGNPYGDPNKMIEATQSALNEAEARSRAGREKSYRSSRKKFITEV
jgi:hypothetical protein